MTPRTDQELFQEAQKLFAAGKPLLALVKLSGVKDSRSLPGCAALRTAANNACDDENVAKVRAAIAAGFTSPLERNLTVIKLGSVADSSRFADFSALRAALGLPAKPHHTGSTGSATHFVNMPYMSLLNGASRTSPSGFLRHPLNEGSLRLS